jgi:plastocyanin
MRQLLRAALLTLIAGITFIACASSGSPSATGAGGASAATVDIKSFAFGPASVTITKGQSVRWTNSDGTPHTVTSGAAPTKDGKFDNQVANGGSTTIAFDTAGTFAYFCNIHPTMIGTVVVNN